MNLTLVPVYGRDYRNKKTVFADWVNGKAFIIDDITHPFDGKLCSIRDMKELKKEGYKGVNLRYKDLTLIAVFNF